ncbi:MAG: hypothetical protein QXX68_02760 [Candidatus Pacearchaeota archaeon]
MTIAHKSPIVKAIVFNLIREVHYEKFRLNKKYSIDVSIIPEIKEDIIIKKGYKTNEVILKKRTVSILIPKKQIVIRTETPIREDNKEKIKSTPTEFKESLINQNVSSELISAKAPPSSQIKRPAEQIQQKSRIRIVPINLMINPPNYGKLNPFIRDPSVSMIFCDGPEKPLKIIRNGQEQITNVVMVKQEIMNLLFQISAKTRIPLIEEGVYRVSWDDFIINAIVSEFVELSFVIKKI